MAQKPRKITHRQIKDTQSTLPDLKGQIDSPNSSKNIFLKDELFSEGKKKIAAAVILALATAATFVGKAGWRHAKEELLKLRNISNADAKLVATKLLGDGILLVNPFRQMNDGKQYVLALTNNSDLYLLDSASERHTVTKLEPTCIGDGVDVEDAVGVLDLHHDGNHQVFAVCRQSMSSGNTFDAYLLDIASMSSYQGTSESQFSGTDSHYDFAGKEPADAELKEWFEERLKEADSSLTFSSDDYANEVKVWAESNKRVFSNPLILHYYPGPPPVEDFVLPKIAKNRTALYCVFKGPMFGYDASSNKHYVIYAPEDEYSWGIGSLEDDRYLLIFVHTGHSVVLDKKLQKLMLYGEFVTANRGIKFTDAKGREVVLDKDPPNDDLRMDFPTASEEDLQGCSATGKLD